MSTVTRVMETLVDLFRLESETSTFEFDRKHLGPVVWIECGDSFSASRLASAALAKNFDPRRALRAIRVVRAHETADLIRALENIRSSYGAPVVVLSNPLVPFGTDPGPEANVQREFNRFMSGVIRQRENGLVITVPSLAPLPASRRSFLPRFMNLFQTDEAPRVIPAPHQVERPFAEVAA